MPRVMSCTLSQIENTDTRASAMTLAQRYRHEGRHEGILKGGQDDVIEVLEVRFGTVPEGLVEAVRGVSDDDHLRRLHRAAIQTGGLEEFRRVL